MGTGTEKIQIIAVLLAPPDEAKKRKAKKEGKPACGIPLMRWEAGYNHCQLLRVAKNGNGGENRRPVASLREDIATIASQGLEGMIRIFTPERAEYATIGAFLESCGAES